MHTAKTSLLYLHVIFRELFFFAPKINLLGRKVTLLVARSSLLCVLEDFVIFSGGRDSVKKQILMFENISSKLRQG